MHRAIRASRSPAAARPKRRRRQRRASIRRGNLKASGASGMCRFRRSGRRNRRGWHFSCQAATPDAPRSSSASTTSGAAMPGELRCSLIVAPSPIRIETAQHDAARNSESQRDHSVEGDKRHVRLRAVHSGGDPCAIGRDHDACWKQYDQAVSLIAATMPPCFLPTQSRNSTSDIAAIPATARAVMRSELPGNSSGTSDNAPTKAPTGAHPAKDRNPHVATSGFRGVHSPRTETSAAAPEGGIVICRAHDATSRRLTTRSFGCGIIFDDVARGIAALLLDADLDADGMTDEIGGGDFACVVAIQFPDRFAGMAQAQRAERRVCQLIFEQPFAAATIRHGDVDFDHRHFRGRRDFDRFADHRAVDPARREQRAARGFDCGGFV